MLYELTQSQVESLKNIIGEATFKGKDSKTVAGLLNTLERPVGISKGEEKAIDEAIEGVIDGDN
jgi:hypothetical protein